MRKKGCRFESEGPARRTLALIADGLNRSATVPSTSSLLFPADAWPRTGNDSPVSRNVSHAPVRALPENCVPPNVPLKSIRVGCNPSGGRPLAAASEAATTTSRSMSPRMKRILVRWGSIRSTLTRPGPRSSGFLSRQFLSPSACLSSCTSASIRTRREMTGLPSQRLLSEKVNEASPTTAAGPLLAHGAFSMCTSRTRTVGSSENPRSTCRSPIRTSRCDRSIR